ncbi:3-hydroxy-3-methylglutaryl-coenzyme A reductase [Halodesulfurarchaeum formicicum]|uniref:3-hydroxy-3-methylglutaryl coenzyme A reductase n=1 Tax=Halodesulfurarchaeum formicicum TaxID=1873524 RepID=A0A1D8S1K8_9EURY|nr:hydroxymethylglutaryl-CoA reductase, degradative [Halodesulfurarchaeum formicicum]AOW79244.1 3-hydroxy-3-methylglutaryl-coenzyme A reductase [Halodesulfurarchaeum formicicum]
MDSRISGFYKLPVEERRETIADLADLSAEATEAIGGTGLDDDRADTVSENVIGTLEYPLSVATNFRVDGEDRLIPMAIEETSVVAAASYAARMARTQGGFETEVDAPRMIAQIQAVDVADPQAARMRILKEKERLQELADEQDPTLVKFGGGCEDIEVRVIDTPTGQMVVTHLIVNVQDAMGGNAVNTMAEALAPEIEALTGGDVEMRILSNLADRRLARATCTIPPEELTDEDSEFTGEEVRDRIVDAWAFAMGDPYRAATHNKGIMNGIDAVTTATFNDWRAMEAGAHVYAARDGYDSLTSYEVDADGNLACSIELPIQVGTVGGATGLQPVAQAAMEILDVDSAEEMAGVLASVGLAQNLAALRALVSEGIQQGHMSLHAQNLAIQAGAEGDQIDAVASRMIEEGDIGQAQAEAILEELEE